MWKLNEEKAKAAGERHSLFISTARWSNGRRSTTRKQQRELTIQRGDRYLEMTRETFKPQRNITGLLFIQPVLDPAPTLEVIKNSLIGTPQYYFVAGLASMVDGAHVVIYIQGVDGFIVREHHWKTFAEQ